MQGSKGKICPAGTTKDPRRCDKCTNEKPPFTVWSRACKFRCDAGFHRSPFGCASCSRSCQPGQALMGTCDPFSMIDGTFCDTCPVTRGGAGVSGAGVGVSSSSSSPSGGGAHGGAGETLLQPQQLTQLQGALPTGASYVSHCTHACPPGQCRHAGSNSCIEPVTPCKPGYKLRSTTRSSTAATDGGARGVDGDGEDADEQEQGGACPKNPASAVKMILQRLLNARHFSPDQLKTVLTALDAVPSHVRSVRDLNPVARFASSLCEPCDEHAKGYSIPKGAVWRNGCAWECPRDFYLHTELDLASVNRSILLQQHFRTQIQLQNLYTQQQHPVDTHHSSHHHSGSGSSTTATTTTASPSSVGGGRALAAMSRSSAVASPAPVVQSCLPCTATCPAGYEAVGECPAGSNHDGRTCGACRFGAQNRPLNSVKDPTEPCGYSCEEGFFKHPVTRACVACTKHCKPGFKPIGECSVGSTRDRQCKACSVAHLPDAAHFVKHCDWECAEGYYKPRGQSACLPCTSASDCPAGTLAIGECPAGSHFDAVTCSWCEPLPRNARWIETRQPQQQQHLQGERGRIVSCEWTCEDGHYKSPPDEFGHRGQGRTLSPHPFVYSLYFLLRLA